MELPAARELLPFNTDTLEVAASKLARDERQGEARCCPRSRRC